MSQIQSYTVSLGADPEFFFKKDGEVIGSEKVIPVEGLGDNSLSPMVIRDGVQAELNPHPNTCREDFAKGLRNCFIKLADVMGDDVSVTINPDVKISQKEMDSLTDDSKKFGCASSKNSHGTDKIKVNPLTYLHRAGGGHIHLGRCNEHYKNDKLSKVLASPERTVAMLDLLVGNTCVLIDCNRGNIERRRHYGRAGEYRLPPHGLEYRTLSNFWLRNYQMVSLVMGLARHATDIVASSTVVKTDSLGRVSLRDGERAFDKELLSLVKMKDVVRAINKNDFDLAYSNFKKIEGLLMKITPDDTYIDRYPICKSNIKSFHKFVKKGLDYYLPEKDVVNYWVNFEGGQGFKEYIKDNV